MKFPSLLREIFNPTSRKVALGWQVFIWATYGAFFAHKASGEPLLDASTWLLAVTASTALIGGGTIMDNKHKLDLAKLGGTNAPVPDPK